MVLHECPRCGTEIVEMGHNEMLLYPDTFGEFMLTETLWSCPNCGFEIWVDDQLKPEEFNELARHIDDDATNEQR